MIAEAKAALDSFNAFVYTYDTRYETDRRHARVYRCRSHVDCGDRIKIISALEAGRDIHDTLYQFVVSASMPTGSEVCVRSVAGNAGTSTVLAWLGSFQAAVCESPPQ